VVNPRKLAAIDVALLGARLIIAEFAGGVLLCPGLGVFVLVRGHGSLAQLLLGVYLILVGVNYVPMLIYAIVIAREKSAQSELGEELQDKRNAMAKYRRQSVLLLVPLLVPIVALTQRSGQR
jgi:uncharacterized membrane protein YqaE (UPF0057 family)